jgi:hypothetical protein
MPLGIEWSLLIVTDISLVLEKGECTFVFQVLDDVVQLEWNTWEWAVEPHYVFTPTPTWNHYPHVEKSCSIVRKNKLTNT